MHMLRTSFSLLLSAVMLSATPAAYAQSDYDSGENGESNTARLQVKISALEEQVRKLQGSIEQASFENRQLKTQMEKANTDIEFRLNALEKKQSALQPPVPQETPTPDSGKLQPVEPAHENNSSDATQSPLPKFANSREHYNYAFRLLNQNKYPDAGSAFTAFTKTYPKDPLIGNAYYWLGETWYVRHDYIKAADDFRLGYEAMPGGPKAADNLLRLALSMNALKKNKEACIVLKKVVTKFGEASSNMKLRAEQEMNTIGCN